MNYAQTNYGSSKDDLIRPTSLLHSNCSSFSSTGDTTLPWGPTAVHLSEYDLIRAIGLSFLII